MNTESEINSNNFYNVYKIKSNKDNLYDIEIYIYKDDDEKEELIIYTTKFEDKIKTEFIKNVTYDELKKLNCFSKCII